MALHIYIAHSGEHLLADPVVFASPESLRTWIVRHTSIPSSRQILMTARGRNVKTQTLATESEIFVYDRQYVSEPADFELPDLPSPDTFKPQSPPASLADQNDLQSWRTLFQTRRDWAQGLASQCESTDGRIKEHRERTDVITRAVGVALENLKSHVGSLEHRFQEAQTWANNLLEEQQAALDDWQRALRSLENIVARKDLPMLGRPSTPKKNASKSTGTLRDFVDVNEVYRAGADASNLCPRLAAQVRALEEAVGNIASDTQDLVDQTFANSADRDDGLLEEVETLAKKIESDYEHVLGLQNNPKTLANVSRLAFNHTQNLLPSLLELSSDIHRGLELALRQRSDAEKVALRQMRTISSIESRLADAHAQLADLGFDTKSFDTLYAVFQMPVVYGSVLIEAIRRREWNEKVRADSESLAEEMSVLRDEEHRRRKKWVKSMGDFISLDDTTTPAMEISLQRQDSEWPEVTRAEVETYIEDLRNKHSLAEIADELVNQLKDLDVPTRQQRRRTKAFKNGSVFDLGRSSMLLRGDEMVRSLQDEKTKLEERLRGSDSRIRKLEDLLHRQSHLSRPSSGNFGNDFPVSPASPHPDALSRRSSVSSRRVSMTQSPEDRALVQRIVTLEAELSSERETVQRLHKEAHAERQSSSDKYQEAQSTKQDLIGNLEARQREFEDERRYLDAELKKYRLRAEEVEEELDRLVDSRDQERQEMEERVQQLETELRAARTQNAEVDRRAEDLSKQVISLERKEAELHADFDRFEAQRAELSEKEREYWSALQAAFWILSPGGKAPTELPDMIKAIEVLAEGLSIHARNAEGNASKLTEENKEFEEKISQLTYELEGRLKVAEDREAELNRLTHQIKEQASNLDFFKSELDQERSRFNMLQSQVSAGENGSDALREQIAEGERLCADLTRKLVDAESYAQEFESKEKDWEARLDGALQTNQNVTSRLDARGTQSHEISKEIYSQVEKLERMLEQLGFAIIQQDGRLVVQRASKLSTSSTLSESIAQSGIVTARPDSSLLHWMHADNIEDEHARFTAFMNSLKQFDVAVFGDVVVKRVKDIETLARKWQKEAKGYREKYHRVQSEAHDKIAYRSFKEGDLALFLPTRNQAIRSWAAFNVGAPHYFLREQDSHKLQTRDWLLARISKIEERVVDLSKSLSSVTPDRRSLGDASDGASADENPFELSDGLRWYLLDAMEEKPGAPATPGIAKSTVAAANVDAKGSIRLKRTTEESTVAQTLSKSLESRRNSSNSKRGSATPSQAANDSSSNLVRSAEAEPSVQPRDSARASDEVRRDLLFGP
ncbi:Autophagy-related protein 11 [Penicillium diatomitis]|uniref:Autophagy-related protein 11 n=1 Tax=Penicillium diatomitis TaxID=2819901 RepID=A0A9X0C067_9EURO|nr:Autophagy-related protein 11 [Penicillium diatomitis]KAJ5493148.1 Autophagy-related protein 11 [Penicillium diatomitis]